MSEAIVWLLFAIRAEFSIDLSVPSSIVYGNPGTFPHLQPTRGITPAKLCPSGLVARNTSETSSVQGSFGASRVAANRPFVVIPTPLRTCYWIAIHLLSGTRPSKPKCVNTSSRRCIYPCTQGHERQTHAGWGIEQLPVPGPMLT
jgi:hypothetical protein